MRLQWHVLEVPLEAFRCRFVEHAGDLSDTAEHRASFVADCHEQCGFELRSVVDERFCAFDDLLLGPLHARADSDVAVE